MPLLQNTVIADNDTAYKLTASGLDTLIVEILTDQFEPYIKKGWKIELETKVKLVEC